MLTLSQSVSQSVSNITSRASCDAKNILNTPFTKLGIQEYCDHPRREPPCVLWLGEPEVPSVCAHHQEWLTPPQDPYQVRTFHLNYKDLTKSLSGTLASRR